MARRRGRRLAGGVVVAIHRRGVVRGRKGYVEVGVGRTATAVECTTQVRLLIARQAATKLTSARRVERGRRRAIEDEKGCCRKAVLCVVGVWERKQVESLESKQRRTGQRRAAALGRHTAQSGIARAAHRRGDRDGEEGKRSGGMIPAHPGGSQNACRNSGSCTRPQPLVSRALLTYTTTSEYSAA